MVLSAPIDWGSIYAAIYSWTYWAMGWRTRWADQPAPRPDYPYLILDITSDRREGGVDEIVREVDLTRARDIKLTPVAANNQLYRIVINGVAHDYTSDADATVAEISSGLVSAIAAGSEPVTATDNGTDLNVVGDPESLSPSTPGIFRVEVDGPLSWANNDEGNEVSITATGSTEFTLNIQGFHRNSETDYPATDPDRNAYAALSVLRASLGLPSVQARLRAVNVAVVEELQITDLSEAVEDTFISRASLDVRMRTRHSLTEYTGYIASVSGDLTVLGSKDSPISDGIAVES